MAWLFMHVFFFLLLPQFTIISHTKTHILNFLDSKGPLTKTHLYPSIPTISSSVQTSLQTSNITAPPLSVSPLHFYYPTSIYLNKLTTTVFYRVRRLDMNMDMDWAMRRQMQMQMQIPSFGNWECYDDLPVTQYFDSTRYGGHLRHHFYMEDAGHDLFKIPPSPLPYQYHLTQTRKLNKEKKHQKQRRVCDENQQKLQQEETIYRQRTPKAVDEDLYKIPPELLYQKPKKDKIMVCDFWKRCLGLNCIS